MTANPIIVMSFGIAPEQETDFREFFQHRYLPELLQATPEITVIRRYEELCGLGSQNWYTRQFLTILELRSDKDIDKVDSFLARPQTSKIFQEWKTDRLRSFHQAVYKNRWIHERQPADGAFGNRPFFFWAHELKPDVREALTSWYEDDYLPIHMSDVPSWSACRRYVSLGLETTRYLTFYEAADEPGLVRCTDEMRSSVRNSENEIFREKFGPGVSWQYIGSFKQIFRRPG